MGRSRSRTVLMAAAGLGAGVLGGCAHVENTPPEPTPATPLLIDEAMQARVWNRETAWYENGDTVAGGTGFPYRAKPGQDKPWYAVEDPGLFVAQTVAFPVTVWFTRPWEERTWTGQTVEPTYTAQLPLPEEPAAPPSRNPNEPPMAEANRPATEPTLPAPSTTTSPAEKPGPALEQQPPNPGTPGGPATVR